MKEYLSDRNSKRKLLVYLLLLCLALGIIVFHYLDTLKKYNWWIFFLWLAVFGVSIIYSLLHTPRLIFEKTRIIVRQDWKIILLILVLAFFTRFFLLATYPYITIGDELRDPGLYALHIKSGQVKDLFSLGSYQGYGNFIGLTSFFFSLILNNSHLIYRIPAALAGIVSILLTYFIGRIISGKKVAIIASIFLTGSIIHLHYSRTELLVILDSLFSPLFFLAVYSTLYSLVGFFLTGLLFGFSLHFYAGIRVIILLSILFIMILAIRDFINNSNRKNYVLLLQKHVGALVLIIAGFIIGLGPQINVMFKENLFFRAGTVHLLTEDKTFTLLSIWEKLVYINNLYQKAFSVYIFEPTTTHFAFKNSLLTFPLNWLFLTGLFYLLLDKNKNRNILRMTLFMVFIVFLYPIFSQVMINRVGADHRLLSVVPFLSLIAAVGLIKLSDVNIFFQKINVSYSLAIIILIINLSFFFIVRPSDMGYVPQEYAFQQILEYIKQDDKADKYFIPFEGENNYSFNTLHHREKTEFFTNPKKVQLISMKDFSHEIQNTDDRAQKYFFYYTDPSIQQIAKYSEVILDCTRTVLPKYYCPLGFGGNMKFYIYKM